MTPYGVRFDDLTRIATQYGNRRELIRAIIGLSIGSGPALSIGDGAAEPTGLSQLAHCEANGKPCAPCQACQAGQCVTVVDWIGCDRLPQLSLTSPPTADFCYETLPDIYLETNSAARIGFNTPAGANGMRQAIIEFLWKGIGLPTSDAVYVTTDVPNPIDTFPIPNLAGVDELAVMVGELTSRASTSGRESVATNSSFHAGHTDLLSQAGGDLAIRLLVAQGYDVVGFFMPGYGPNTPLPDLPARHDVFAGRENKDFTPLIYFLEPVAVALNFLTTRFGFSDIGMIGISGGGWTTTLYAAIDSRVRLSYSIAGSLPLWLRTPPCGTTLEMGDWEQSGSALYQMVDYTALYALGAYGDGREQVQVFNQYDSCCFWGVRYRAYEDEVGQLVAALGSGSFRVIFDSTTRQQHALTPWALQHLFPNVTQRCKSHRRPRFQATCTR